MADRVLKVGEIFLRRKPEGMATTKKSRLAKCENPNLRRMDIAATAASIPESACGLRIGFRGFASVYRERTFETGFVL